MFFEISNQDFWTIFFKDCPFECEKNQLEVNEIHTASNIYFNYKLL